MEGKEVLTQLNTPRQQLDQRWDGVLFGPAWNYEIFSAHLHLFPARHTWPKGGVSFGRGEISWRAELGLGVSFSTSTSICAALRQKNNNHVIGHNYDDYSINAVTSPELTVRDKERI